MIPWPTLAGAFSFGLVGSLHCASMCGAFALISRGHPAWQGGRVLVYGVLGAVVGAVGDQFAASSWPPALRWFPWILAAAALVLSTAKLLGWAPTTGSRWARMAGSLSGRAARLGQRFPRPVALSLLGASSALLPCGLLWAALGIAATSGGGGAGLGTMLAFGLGTSPALAAVALSASRLAARPTLRRATAVAVLTVGGLALGSRMPVQAADDAPTCDCEGDSPTRGAAAGGGEGGAREGTRTPTAFGH